MHLNRKQQPEFSHIDNVNIPVPEKLNLNNGIKTYVINAGTQDVIKIDLTFNAGSWYQDKPIIATIANEMLIEGTKNMTSRQIAEKLDFYGAFMHPQPTKDFGNITLYTLKKYLPETIKILEDIVKNPTFPIDELVIFLNKRKQQFQVDLEKVINIARREFNEQLFGKNHPYGIKTQIDDYNNVNQKDIVQFHNKFYHSDNCKIILSGKINEKDISLINKHFGGKDWSTKYQIEGLNFNITGQPQKESIIEKENATQSAIRLGKAIINKDHTDYHKLNVVNTILGGYFGSRLMKTIREEKGYTYGINSVLVSLKNAAYFVILSEVGAHVAKNAINDILHEIKILRETKVAEEELDLVKNYMLGDLLRSFDGPFEISSSLKSLIDLNLEVDFYDKAVDTINNITSDDVLNIANKYLHEDTLIKTIAGKYN